MHSLRIIDVIIPEHGVIRYIRLRVSLVAAVHGRKLDWIPDEKDRQVIEHKVLYTFLGVELDGPASDITDCVARSFLSTYC